MLVGVVYVRTNTVSAAANLPHQVCAIRIFPCQVCNYCRHAVAHAQKEGATAVEVNAPFALLPLWRKVGGDGWLLFTCDGKWFCTNTEEKEPYKSAGYLP